MLAFAQALFQRRQQGLVFCQTTAGFQYGRLCTGTFLQGRLRERQDFFIFENQLLRDIQGCAGTRPCDGLGHHAAREGQIGGFELVGGVFGQCLLTLHIPAAGTKQVQVPGQGRPDFIVAERRNEKIRGAEQGDPVFLPARHTSQRHLGQVLSAPCLHGFLGLGQGFTSCSQIQISLQCLLDQGIDGGC